MSWNENKNLSETITETVLKSSYVNPSAKFLETSSLLSQSKNDRISAALHDSLPIIIQSEPVQFQAIKLPKIFRVEWEFKEKIESSHRTKEVSKYRILISISTSESQITISEICVNEIYRDYSITIEVLKIILDNHVDLLTRSIEKFNKGFSYDESQKIWFSVNTK